MVDRKRVILVDDSPHDSEFVKRAMEARCPGAEFRSFRCGEEALEYFGGEVNHEENDRTVHMVLLDLKLPGLDGHAILRELRTLWPPWQLPVVVFTSSREPSDVARAYAGGANGYLVKPVVHEAYVDVVGLAVRYWLDANVLEGLEGRP